MYVQSIGQKVRGFLAGRRRAQATTEIAVVGGFILLAFAVMLQYAQTMNRQQSLQMQAFRAALEKSRNLNKEVTYTIVKDGLSFSPLSLVKGMDTTRTTASATVVAMRYQKLFYDDDDKEDRDTREFYNVNGEEFEVDPVKVEIEYDGQDEPYVNWTSAPIVDVEYDTEKTVNTSLSKVENRVGLNTSYVYAVGANDSTTLRLFDQDEFEKNYLEDLHDEVPEHIEEARWEKEQEIQQYWNVFYLGIYTYISGLWDGEEELAAEQAILTVCESLLTVIFDNQLAEGQDPVSGKDAESVKITAGYRSADEIASGVNFSGGTTFSAQN